MSAAAAELQKATPALRWLKPDDYHIRSECGRFTVARRRISGVDWYIAYRREQSVDVTRAHELGATEVQPRATEAQRKAAIRAMQHLCEVAANER